MSWIAVAVGGSAVLGYLGSQNAADAQSGAANKGIGEQRRQFDLNRSDLAPYRSAGQSALNALLIRLGLSPSSGPGSSGSAPTREQFTTTAAGTPSNLGPGANVNYMGQPRTTAGGYITQKLPGMMTPGGSTFDQAGYDKAMQDYQSAQGANSSDPNFGSLLKPFTGADLATEPGYQFGLTEGEKAINNLAATRGNYFSGGAAKDLAKYTQDYAGTKFNEGFNRDQATKSLTNNLLSGVSNQGLGATNAGVQAGGVSTNAISDLMTQGGNAQAAGYVGGANAINQGVGNYINWNNQSRTLDLLRNPSYGKAPASGYGSMM